MTNSHILFHKFDYYEPVTLDEALALLAQLKGSFGDGAQVLAGGTDLLVQMKIERSAPQALLSINRIPGLERIEAREERLSIGARATIREVERHPLVRAGHGALAEACASFSSTQIQTTGTIGGNLGNASPAADTAPALIAFGAELELVGPQGARSVPVEEFFVAPGRSALGAGELITGVVLPFCGPGTGSAFAKIGRVTNDIAKANCAVVIDREGSRIVDCRMAFGSVAPTPMRARKAEQLLIGQAWSEELADRAAEQAAEEISPIDDVRSTAWYRREAVRSMAGDGLRRAWQRAGVVRAVHEPPLPSADSAPGSRTSSGVQYLGAREQRLIELGVNGRRRQVWVSPNDLLLNVLRDDLQMTGTKYGCGIGECSACTVLMDGKPALACLVLAVAAAGHEIVTVEGLAGADGTLDPLQEAFIDFAAYQCGYCTPGMLMTAKSLLAEVAQPTEEEIRHYLRGNICRCTGYAAIVRAVLAAADASDQAQVAELAPA